MTWQLDKLPRDQSPMNAPQAISGMLAKARVAVLAVLIAVGWPVGLVAVAEPSGVAGVWLIDNKAVVQIFDCGQSVCGRIIWLRAPLTPQGQPKKDKNNPDSARRQRSLCGLIVLWALHREAEDIWDDGWFYNPDDGNTYHVTARLSSDRELIARIYSGLPIFGETKILRRIPANWSERWCLG